jgi:hypothetical protein
MLTPHNDKDTKAKCERTNTEIKLSEGFFVANKSSGEWSFVAKAAPEGPRDYNVQVSRLVASPAALVDWMAHLNEKAWFQPKKFFEFFTAFRAKNNLFNKM